MPRQTDEASDQQPDYAPLPGQPFGAKSGLTSLAHVQVPAVFPDERVSVMVLPNTGPGALTSVHVIVPAPSVAVPEAASVQLEVVAAALPATNSNVGLVPWLMMSSKGTFNALISARPAVTLARA